MQSWSGELADQGNQWTREEGKRGKIKVLVPGCRDILELNLCNLSVSLFIIPCNYLTSQQFTVRSFVPYVRDNRKPAQVKNSHVVCLTWRWHNEWPNHFKHTCFEKSLIYVKSQISQSCGSQLLCAVNLCLFLNIIQHVAISTCCTTTFGDCAENFFEALLCYHISLFSRKQNVFLSANHLVNQTNLLMKTVKDALN